MGTGHNGHAVCRICGAELRMLTFAKRNMMGLCRAWRNRHEPACSKRTPAQRRSWAKKYAGADSVDSSITVDIGHPAFQDSASADTQSGG